MPLVFFYINIMMKTFKQIIQEAKINYSTLSAKDIDKHHAKLTPEEKSRFSEIVDPDKSIPVLTQQRNALQTIHSDREKSK